MFGNMTSTFLKLFSPLIGIGGVGLLYWHLNIGQRLFSKGWGLGCGCNDGFNTNHLTHLVCFTLLASTGAGCWFSSTGLPRRWRLGYLGFCGFLLLAFFRQFIYYNLWA
ncbi:MAG TPA: hypothetical protein VN673_12770 [Clostridia bacterium]|nr:hypothetical protein [Clostridia bacterium]